MTNEIQLRRFILNVFSWLGILGGFCSLMWI